MNTLINILITFAFTVLALYAYTAYLLFIESIEFSL